MKHWGDYVYVALILYYALQFNYVFLLGAGVGGCVVQIEYEEQWRYINFILNLHINNYLKKRPAYTSLNKEQ